MHIYIYIYVCVYIYLRHMNIHRKRGGDSQVHSWF